MILLGGLVRSRLVAVFNSPLVVVVDPGIKSGLADIVLRLSDIVETGIVHDTDRVTVLLDPLLVTEFRDRSHEA